MTVPRVAAIATPPTCDAAQRAVTLVLGPSLGTTTTVWDRARPLLAARHPLLAWDLPGHGRSAATTAPFSMAELAEGVLAAIDEAGLDRVAYAGVSLGGMLGLQLALDHPERVETLTMVCSLPRIGSPAGWSQRAMEARAQGTPSLVTGSASRWFTPEFLEREPDVSARMLHRLLDIDDESYALCVDALGATDLRARVSELRVPLTLIVGERDPIIDVEEARATARSAPRGTVHVIGGASHLAVVEQPEQVAEAILQEASST